MSSIDSSGAARSLQNLDQSSKSTAVQQAKGKSFGLSVSHPSKSTSLPSVRSAPPLATSPDQSRLLSSRSVSSHTPTQSFLGGASAGSGTESLASTSSSFSSFGSSFDENESVTGSLSDSTSVDSQEQDDTKGLERTDTRSRKQKAADRARSAGRKLKSKLYGQPKRWLTGKSWKKVPKEALAGFPKELRTQVEARNQKLERLGELKELKQDWQQFERQFGKELDLLDADTAPKTGTFKIPDTGEEFVFSKSQSKQQRKELLAEFKKAFDESPGHTFYLHASFQTSNIDADRATLKEELSLVTKELNAGVDQHFDQKEDLKHAELEKATVERHEALDAEKGRVEEGYDKLIVLYQDQVNELTRDLSDLRQRKDDFKNVKIPAKERQIERLEDHLKRDLSAQKAKYKKLSSSQKKGISREQFLQPLRADYEARITTAKREHAKMQQEVNSYKDDRAELRQELKKAEKSYKKVVDNDAFGATLKKLDKRSKEQDKVADKEDKLIPEQIKQEKKETKRAIRGR